MTANRNQNVLGRESAMSLVLEGSHDSVGILKFTESVKQIDLQLAECDACLPAQRFYAKWLRSVHPIRVSSWTSLNSRLPIRLPAYPGRKKE